MVIIFGVEAQACKPVSATPHKSSRGACYLISKSNPASANKPGHSKTVLRNKARSIGAGFGMEVLEWL
jgi:hypothetical protein